VLDIGASNLDLVRSIIADWERGDYFSRAVWADPDIEFVVVDGPEPDSWKGRMEMARAWRSYLRTWEDYRGAVDGYREIDDDRVLVLARRTGRAKASGVDLAQMPNQSATIFEIHDGKVTRLVIYVDRDRAFADLGLAPEGEGT
jgi:ketosteroid isomerase-like protein